MAERAIAMTRPNAVGPWLAGVMLALPLLSGTARAAEPLTLEATVDAAVRQAPDLTAGALEAEAARSAAVSAAELPDPKLFFGLDNFPVTGPAALTLNGDDMTMLTVGVTQDLPNRPKRRARTARAQAEIGAADAELALRRRELRAAAAVAWIDLLYAGRRLSALDALDRENLLFADVLPERIGNGSAEIGEAVSPGLLAAAVEDRRTSLRAGLEKAKAELRRWIGDAAAEPMADAPALTVDPVRIRSGLAQHPVLLAFSPKIARAEAEVFEAEATKRPDWGFQAAFHARDPKYGEMVSAQVTVDLPLFTRRRQEPLIAARKLQVNAAKAQREGARRSLEAEFDKALVQHSATHEQLGRERETTLPLLRRKADLQLASYRAGGADFATVLAARRDVVEAELKALDLEAENRKAAARLVFYYGDQGS